MKTKHLVVYDYGQGGRWAFVLADSAQAIKQRYPELRVVTETPAWMNDDVRARLDETETYDLTAPPTGLLLDLLQQRARDR
jgi:hypothetical protein